MIKIILIMIGIIFIGIWIYNYFRIIKQGRKYDYEENDWKE